MRCFPLLVSTTFNRLKPASGQVFVQMMFRTGGEEATLLEERGGLANRIRLKGGRLLWEWQVVMVVLIF